LRKNVILSIIAVFLLLLIINKAAGAYGNFSSPVLQKKIALINITGEISDTTHVLELLKTYDDMPSIKAIVLRVDSPGGGVAASQEVYRQIEKVRKDGKKVVVSMGDTAASGAYYLSCAADKIYANPGTLTGSIGVIMNFFDAEKLLGKIGVNYNTIKSGKYKDTGSFSRPVTEDDKAILNKLIKDVLDQFVDDVIKGRQEQLCTALKIKDKDPVKKKALLKDYMLKNIADGRVFTGREAKELGLVDEIGSIDDAIEGTADLVGIKGRPSVVTERKRTGLQSWLDSKIPSFDFRGKSSSGFALQYILK
jgi:protease-4